MSSLRVSLGWTAPCERRDPSAEGLGDLLLEALVPERLAAVGRGPQAVDETVLERVTRIKA